MTDSRISDPDQPLRSADLSSAPPVSGRVAGAPGGSEPRGEIAGEWWRLALVVAVTVVFGLWAGKGWLLIIAALTVMIFLHELGHYLTAKWSGMKVTEFFLFFGPKIWSFRRGETEYGIKLIPVGAYVRIIGMNNLDETPPEDEPRTFRQQSYPKRLLVVSAGSLMHLLQAFVLFLLVFSWVGVPAYTDQAERLGATYDESDWVIGSVSEGSGAADAGMRPGDDLVSIDGRPVTTFADVGPLVEDRAGDTVDLVVDRDGELVALDATIGRRPDDRSAGFLGVGGAFPDRPAVTAGPVRSVVAAAEVTAVTVRQTVGSLVGFFTGGMGDFVSSVVEGDPDGDGVTVGGSGSGGGRVADEGDESRLVSIYGVARIGADMSEDGMAGFLLLLAFVNISIGVLNMIPLLPLDGGHAAIATYERIRSIGGRRHMADVSRLLPLTYAVVMFLLLIGVSSIYLDIVDPIGVG
ncbi:MAG: site-2 protease family protein [Acidimicrobiales bacterium]